jgi:hypothetical protein
MENTILIKRVGDTWVAKWPDDDDFVRLTGWYGGNKPAWKVIAKLKSLPANTGLDVKVFID